MNNLLFLTFGMLAILLAGILLYAVTIVLISIISMLPELLVIGLIMYALYRLSETLNN